MQTINVQQLLLKIFNTVDNEKPIEFHYIKTWQEFSYYRQYLKATKLILRILQKSSKSLFNNYCKDVVTGKATVIKILAYVRLNDAITFYNKELQVINQMLEDYDIYLGDGHFWFSFFGGQRII